MMGIKIILGLALVFALSLLTGSMAQGVGSIVTKPLFDQMFKHRSEGNCAKGFYTYEAFIQAANAYPAFGTTGDINTRKREIAAFLGQTSHETTGGWPSAPDGPYAWGYCFKQEQNNQPDYCKPSQQWPCAPGKKYYGRGPIQLTSNLNYGPAGQALKQDLLNNPDLVANDAVISFKAAFWFWMTPQPPKPSSHDVITGRWTPSATDRTAGRVPGYGMITNIINGGIECGTGSIADKQQDRIGFYQRYCGILGVGSGTNLDCANQKSYPN
nr:basic endochitinase-like [Ipomoea batatas]